MTYPPPASQALLCVCVVTAAVWDLRTRRIPNWLTLSSFLLGLLLNVILFGRSGLWFSLAGTAVALGIYLPLYLLRAMGAGDVKLMAGIGTLLGASNWLAVFIFTGIFGGLCALAVIAHKKRVGTTLWNVHFIASSLLHFRAPYTQKEELDLKSAAAVTLPHGLAIALGAIAFLIVARIQAAH